MHQDAKLISCANSREGDPHAVHAGTHCCRDMQAAAITSAKADHSQLCTIDLHLRHWKRCVWHIFKLVLYVDTALLEADAISESEACTVLAKIDCWPLTRSCGSDCVSHD
jgi:hypothetical protein